MLKMLAESLKYDMTINLVIYRSNPSCSVSLSSSINTLTPHAFFHFSNHYYLLQHLIRPFMSFSFHWPLMGLPYRLQLTYNQIIKWRTLSKSLFPKTSAYWHFALPLKKAAPPWSTRGADREVMFLKMLQTFHVLLRIL